MKNALLRACLEKIVIRGEVQAAVNNYWNKIPTKEPIPVNIYADIYEGVELQNISECMGMYLLFHRMN